VGEVFELMAQGAGWDHLGIGSDLDGGIGVDESPVELESIADIHKIGEVVPDEARAGVLGENWLRFLREALPDGVD
jgi:membrane dipeptidase